MIELIERVFAIRGKEFLEEVTIELNPDPFDEVLDFVRETGKLRKISTESDIVLVYRVLMTVSCKLARETMPTTQSVGFLEIAAAQGQ
ncbi:MAG: hypothetical protein H6765_00020 [Candidatus Peribacteria bacterium]|nr:MAG: hypothetical protein H6765_00020 [Candidatus Peribacteria bacterium]